MKKVVWVFEGEDLEDQAVLILTRYCRRLLGSEFYEIRSDFKRAFEVVKREQPALVIILVGSHAQVPQVSILYAEIEDCKSVSPVLSTFDRSDIFDIFFYCPENV